MLKVALVFNINCIFLTDLLFPPLSVFKVHKPCMICKWPIRSIQSRQFQSQIPTSSGPCQTQTPVICPVGNDRCLPAPRAQGRCTRAKTEMYRFCIILHLHLPTHTHTHTQGCCWKILGSRWKQTLHWRATVGVFMPHEVATSVRICTASTVTLGGVIRCLGSKVSGTHICSLMYCWNVSSAGVVSGDQCCCEVFTAVLWPSRPQQLQGRTSPSSKKGICWPLLSETVSGCLWSPWKFICDCQAHLRFLFLYIFSYQGSCSQAPILRNGL